MSKLTERAARFHDVDAYLDTRLVHPDYVQQAEYRLVYDFVRELLLDGHNHREVLASLNELELNVAAIRKWIA